MWFEPVCPDKLGPSTNIVGGPDLQEGGATETKNINIYIYGPLPQKNNVLY